MEATDGGAGGSAVGRDIQLEQAERITELLQTIETLESDKAEQKKECEAEKTRLCGVNRERHGIIAALKADDEEKNKLIVALRAEVVGREGECARIAGKLKGAQSEVETQKHAIARMEDAGLAVDAENIQPRLV